MIWKQKEVTLEGINAFGNKGMGEHLGIEFIEIGPDYLIAKMPVDHRTKQPMGKLHGGASVVLAETVGSVASVLCVEDLMKNSVVGIEINANHLRSIEKGYVYGKVVPIKIGRTLHIWQIDLYDEDKREICRSRLTTQIIKL
jgi:1,4-dihydroxy-2-naphthoyl-CoA hydrolase